MSRFRCLLASIAALLPNIAQAGGPPQTVYVSATAVCDFPSVQAAIDAVPPGSQIRLVGAEFALTTSIAVSNRDLRIAGGYPACGAPAPNGRTVLRADFAGGPVMSVLGNVPGALDLTLIDLDLAEANNPGVGSEGGGLRISGGGAVSLSNVQVRDNFATVGGGIAVVSLGGNPLTLNLSRGTRIGGEVTGGNGAESGGGIYCDGATLRLGNAAIVGNAASGSGGGVRAVGGCSIETTIEPGTTRIDGNLARQGGGIHAIDATIVLGSRPNQPVSISGNAAINGAAPRSGGGVHVGGSTVFEGYGVRIDDNLAREFGGAIVVVGATLRMNRSVGRCLLDDDACSSVSGNSVRNELGAVAGHSALAFVSGGGAPLLDLTQTRVVGNAAAGAILRAVDAGRIELTSTLIAGNASNASLIDNLAAAELFMDFVTLVGNAHVGAAVNNNSNAAPGAVIQRSILMPAAGAASVVGTGSASFLCNNIAGGAHGGDAHDPGFFDAAAGNYRLRQDSQNLDRCAVDGNEDDHDLGGRPRVVDDAQAANAGGTADRGAHEGPLHLFSDSFED